MTRIVIIVIAAAIVPAGLYLRWACVPVGAAYRIGRLIGQARR
jgi:hypothetical protein